jgi:hypothetical protein
VGEQVSVGQPLRQAGTESDPDHVNPLAPTPTGVLTDPSNPTQNDEAPTG